jgi:hypothetical protein
MDDLKSDDKDDNIHQLASLIQSMDYNRAQKLETWNDLLFQKECNFEQMYEKQIKEYWNLRNAYNLKIKKDILNELNNLKQLFIDHDVKLMSSYSANTNLLNSSDIDIGIIVDGLTDVLIQEIDRILVQYGYKFEKKMNEYYCYNRFINIDGIIVEIEVKVRNLNESLTIIRLHNYLDTMCDEKQKMIYTYLKYKLFNLKKIYPRAYTFIKMLFYNMGLLKINPNCTWFITNI